MAFHKQHGYKGAVDRVTNRVESQLPFIFEGFTPKNIFNCSETAIFLSSSLIKHMISMAMKQRQENKQREGNNSPVL